MTTVNDPSRSQRIELILREVDTIPTPSPIALKLLSLASDDNAELSEIVSLIESDPGMTARLLGMCRRSVTGLGSSVTTVERAVVMLGMDAVRAMLLSVDIHEFMVSRREEELDDAAPNDADGPHIDRTGLWRHALAVACAAERIAQTHADDLGGLKPDEAFVCGLLHDIGKIALDLLLPRSSWKAVQLAQRRCEPLASIEKMLIGIDHALVGKRLAERWGLPEPIRDVIWLHGRAPRAIPDLPHKKVIGVVSAADEIARMMHVGVSGSGAMPMSLTRIASTWGFNADRLEQVAVGLHGRVSVRSSQLGMEQTPPAELLVQSLGIANRTLVQLNDMHRKRSQRQIQLETTLRALHTFSDELTTAGTPIDVMQHIAACGRTMFDAQRVISLLRIDDSPSWNLALIDEDGRIRRSTFGAFELSSDALVCHGRPVTELPEHVLSAVADQLAVDSADVLSMHPLVLHADEHSAAIMLHSWRLDRERGAAIASWRASIGGALERERADRLYEQVSELNQELVETQSRAADIESYARLGELSAGAAHEMNNPLAIISGRAQLLRDGLQAGPHRDAAVTIVESAAHLSNLVAGLHFVAAPPDAKRRAVDLTDLAPRVIRDIREERTREGFQPNPIRFVVRGPLPPAHLDVDLFSVALRELILNALEAPDSHHVELHIQTEDEDDRLMVSVQDDGRGIPPEVLAHAVDPFFSSKEAGRRTGMGLAKVRRIVELHGGRFELLPGANGRGAEARIVLDVWRREHLERERGTTAQAA